MRKLGNCIYKFRDLKDSVKKSSPFVSVIVLNYNAKELAVHCLDAILKTDYPNFEVIFVDNDFTDQSLSILEKIRQS